MTKRSTLALGLLCVVGCGNPQPTSPSKPSAMDAQQSEAKSPARPRIYDAPAEKELKALGHTAPEQVARIAEKYGTMRWRFHAEVMRLDAAEPSQFHLNTVTVQPEGLARTYIRLRSADTKANLYPGQKREFEGTFERYIYQSGLDAIVFNDGIIIEQ